MSETLALPGPPGESIAIFFEQFMERMADLMAARIGTSGGSPAKRLMTVASAAEYLDRTPRAIEHLIASGAIPVTKLDGKRQIDKTALDKLILDRTHFEV
jgi:excisionase family DNA binding protein